MFNVQAGLLSVAVINAVYNVIAEIVGKVQGINPIVFSLYRDAAAAPILSSIALAQNRERVFPDRADVARIAVQGFLGIFLNQILFLLGVEWTNGTTGSICNLTLPVFAHAISVSLRLEKLKWATAAGLGLCIVGALVMKVGAESRGTSQERPFLGISVLLLGSLCSALYCIIQKKSLKKYSAVFVTSWEYIFGFLFMLLSALAFADYDRESWKLTEVGILALAFTVLFNSVAKYLLNTICNKFVSATVLTAWSTVVPVLTGILSFILLKAPFQVSYLGSIPVVLGIYIVMMSREADTGSDKYKSLIEVEPY